MNNDSCICDPTYSESAQSSAVPLYVLNTNIRKHITNIFTGTDNFRDEITCVELNLNLLLN